MLKTLNVSINKGVFMANEAVDKTPKRNSALTIVGLVLAIIALTTSWVPIINNIAFALGAAAFIMGYCICKEG